MFGVVIVIKRLISLLSAVLIAMSFSFAANGIKIDGTDSGNEWQKAETAGYYNNNNGVETGIVACIIEDYTAYFRLQLYDNGIKNADSKAGFILCIDGDEILRITATDYVITPKTDKYSVEAEMEFYDNSGVCCEARVGVKNGIGSSLKGTVCFIDNEGIRSNVHPFSFSDNDENQTEETEKTTKIKTTEKATTKKQTTKKVTTERITNKATTVKENKTDKSTTLRLIENKEKYSHKGNVIFVNEVSEETSTEISYESVTQPATKSVYYADSGEYSYTKGQKLKIAVGVGTGVALLLLCTWGAVKTKKDKEKDKEKTNEESDKD